MSQEVKNIPFAAKLFIFTKVNFIEWFNEIYELAIHGWQILWQISSTTPIVCWTRWNLLPWYILKQLTMCKLPETRVKCTFNAFDSWNYLPSELFLWRQNMLWNDQERERVFRKECVFWSKKIHHPFRVILRITFKVFSLFFKERKTVRMLQ